MRKSLLTVLTENLGAAPPVTRADLTGKTVLVVGANTGMGFEASKHFATMNPARLILACRDRVRGQAAVDSISTATGYAAELKIVDLGNSQSVKTFADGFVAEDARLDVVLLNAAIIAAEYSRSSSGFESTLQVNSLGTSHLAIRLLPLLHRSADKYGCTPRLSLVASNGHYIAQLPAEAITAPSIFKAMSEERSFNQVGQQGRYIQSKLLHIFFMRALAAHSSPKVIVNGPNPGYCKSEISRNVWGIMRYVDKFFVNIIARTAEEGSRQLVWAAVGGAPPAGTASLAEPSGAVSAEEMHGQYTSQSRLEEVADYVLSEEGQELQQRIWDETIQYLTEEDPAIPELLRAVKQ